MSGSIAILSLNRRVTMKASSTKKNRIAVVGIAASLLIGAGTGLALGIPGAAGATGTTGAANSVSTPTDDTTPPSTDATETTDQASGTARPERGNGPSEALTALVAAGTITQDQSDAIAAALAADHSGPRGGGADGHGGGGEGHGPDGMGGHGRGRGGMGGAKIAEAAATALGITADELTTELDAGKTIADIASDTGVDLQTVIDAIVADQTAEIRARVTDIVNGVKPTAPTPPADAPNDTTVTTTD